MAKRVRVGESDALYSVLSVRSAIRRFRPEAVGDEVLTRVLLPRTAGRWGTAAPVVHRSARSRHPGPRRLPADAELLAQAASLPFRVGH
jgi:hypothetical protein